MNYKTITYKGISLTGILEENYSVGNNSSDSYTIGNNKYLFYRLKIDPIGYDTINQVYLRLYPKGSDYAFFKVNQGQSFNPTEENYLYATPGSGYMYVSLTRLFNENPYEEKIICVSIDSSCDLYNCNAETPLRPELVIEYYERPNLVNKEQNIGHSLLSGVNAMVDFRSGLPKAVKPLVTFGGELMPIDLSLVYNGVNTTTSSFSGMPKGWKFNYQQKIEIRDNKYYYIDSMGNEHLFEQALESNNIYFDVSGTGLILRRNTNNTYTIFDCYDNELNFNVDGMITNIIKKVKTKEIKTTISYDSSHRLSTVTDGMGRVVTFNYSNVAITVTGIGINTITILFDQNKLLTRITELGNRLTQFNYDSSNKLIKIFDDNYEEIEFDYGSDKRVHTISLKVTKEITKLVKSYSFTYNLKSTILVNELGRFKEYVFDNDGNVEKVIEDKKSISRVVDDNDLVYTTKSSGEYFMQYVDQSFDVSSGGSFSIPNTSQIQNIKPNTYFELKFETKMDNPNSAGFQFLVTIKQGDTIIGRSVFDPQYIGYAIERMYFKTETNDNLTLFVEYVGYSGYNNTFHIRNMEISKIEFSETYPCISIPNKIVDTFELNNKKWKVLGDKYKKSFYGDNNTELPDKMHIGDLLENQRNLKTDKYNTFMWYDNKRGLVLTNKVSIEFDEETLDISNVLLGVLSDKTNVKCLNYSDYNSTSNFKTDYTIVKNGSLELKTETNIDNDYLVSSQKDQNNITTTYTYDDYGRVLKEESYVNASSSRSVKEYQYTNNGLSKKISKINGVDSVTEYTYDSNTGRLLKTTYPNGQVVTNQYDQTSEKLVRLSSENLGNSFSYDKDLLTLLGGSDSKYSFEYNDKNLLERVKQGSEVVEEIETIESEDKIIEKYSLKRTSDTCLMKHYDRYGNLFLVEKSTNNNAYYPFKEIFYSDMEVDDIDNNLSPNDIQLEKYVDSKLRKIKDYEVVNTTKFFYDNKERLAKITNSNSTHYPTVTEVSYDDYDRVVTKTQTFDADEQITTITYKNNIEEEVTTINTVLDYTHDVVSDSIAVTTNDDFSCLLTLENDEFARLKSKNYKFDNAKSIKTTYTYQNTNNMTNNLITSEYHSGFGNRIIYYTYDSMGRIISVKDDNYTTTYEYDTYGRLKRENNQKLNKTFIYSYDVNGNITYKGVADYTTTAPAAYKHDYFTYSAAIPDLLIEWNGVSVNNLNGLMMEYKGTEYEWIRGGLLSKLSYSPSQYVNYYYNADGIRVRKAYSVNGFITNHFYTLDGSKIIHEKILAGSDESELNYLYVGEELVGFVHNGDKYYYEKNFRNDIIGVYNSSGSLVAKYEYDAWGNHKVLSASGVENTSATFIGNINPFRYRGYYYDVETGLFMVGHRYYNPEWGRWLSPDDIEYLDPQSINGLNLYAYCFNDPINYVDYDGHFPVAVKAVTTLIKGAMSLHKIGLQLSLKFFENAPKITMEVAKKMARKGGHVQSARSIMRHQQNLINSTRNSIDDIVKAQKTLGKVLLVADILWNVGENYFSGDPNWVSDSVVDAGISVGIYALGCIPYVGWALALGATAATAIFDDEIEEFKDWFAEGWNNFWNFSWI